MSRTYFTKNNTRYYSAVDPEVLLDKCKQKVHNAQNMMQKMEKILPIFENLKSNNDKVKVQFFEEFEGIKSMFEDVLKDKKPVYGILGIHNICPIVKSYLENEYAPKRNPQITSESKTIFLDNKESISYMEKNYELSKFESIVVCPDLLKLDITIQIYGNKAGFYAIKNSNNLHGVLIESETMVETLKSIFLALFAMTKLQKTK